MFGLFGLIWFDFDLILYWFCIDFVLIWFFIDDLIFYWFWIDFQFELIFILVCINFVLFFQQKIFPFFFQRSSNYWHYFKLLHTFFQSTNQAMTPQIQRVFSAQTCRNGKCLPLQLQRERNACGQAKREDLANDE